MGSKAQHCQHLKRGEQQQVKESGNGSGAPGPQLGLELLLLPGDDFQLQLHPAHRDHIPVLEGADVHPLPVDIGAVLGMGVGDGPAAVVVPGEHRMVPGDGGQGNGHIAAFAPANHIFPVGHRHPFPSGHHQPGPDFWLSAEGEQGDGTAQQQQKCQQRTGAANQGYVKIPVGAAHLRKGSGDAGQEAFQPLRHRSQQLPQLGKELHDSIQN